MGKLDGQVFGAEWWISVVVAGIVVNLVSSYLRSQMDVWGLRYSSWWRSRSAARLAARDAYVRLLLNDERELQSARFRMVNAMLSSIWHIVMPLPLFVIVSSQLSAAFALPTPLRYVFNAFLLAALLLYLFSGLASSAKIAAAAEERRAIREAERLKSRPVDDDV